MAEIYPFFATIPTLSADLRARKVSSEELTKAFAARMQQHGPRYNALALPLTGLGLKKAKEVDREIKRERFRSPLQGIPFAVKDLLSVAGHPTTWGAKPYAGQVFDYDAAVIRRLDKAGAVLIAKLAMVELAGGPSYRYAAASMFGPGLNPWDPTRWAGGSSSGSASAVAAGLAPFAIGSETSGSILTPSAFCGITGLRPTYGLVSRQGSMALSWTLDKIGPMCRTAEDCALVLEAIAGGDANDPGSARKSFYYTPRFARKAQDLRIGYAPVDFAEWAEPSARPAFEKALHAIRETGARLIETRLPDLPYGPAIGTILSCEAGAVFEPLVASGRVDELADARQIAGLKAALEIPAKDYLKAMRVRQLMKERLLSLFADVDVLLTPTRLGPAPKVGDPLDRHIVDRPLPKDLGLTALIPAGNLAGLPALSLPCGLADGLPVGIQLAGRAFSENTLVALGKEFQSRTDWHTLRPPGAG